MSGFRFRAQAALDLRRREDDEAQAVLASSEAGLRAATATRLEADQRAGAARTEWALLARRADGAAQGEWHRSWILRLDGERAAAAAVVVVRQQEQAHAHAARVRTHQRLDALEKFKAKAARVWEQRAALLEQKELDALATIRFVTARRSQADG